ncbi:MAG: MaoC family dehydratase [bacterium]|nr:MaoC family dehydratase [bacterium]
MEQRDRYFEDFAAGDRFEAPESVEVQELEILEFARAYDPQPFHLEHQAAERSIFKRLTASGWLTAAKAMRLFVQSGILRATGIIGLGVDELRWPRPVLPGDRLSLAAEVLETRRSRSNSRQGVMRMRLTVSNQHGETVYSCIPNLLVPLRDHA